MSKVEKVLEVNEEDVTNKGWSCYMKEKKNDYFSLLFSTEFVIIILLGQFLSFCITTTIVTSEELTRRNVNVPTTQTFATYIVLFLVYTPIDIYNKGFKGYFEMLKDKWWKYLLLSIADVEGNYFVVKAYALTTVLSIMLLDAWSTPCVVALLLIFLKVRFHWSQYLAVVICLCGIAVTVISDFQSGGDFSSATEVGKGDAFCIIGATFYAISNVLEEYFVRQRPIYEVVGQMGLYGTIVSGIQLAALERTELSATVWDGPVVGYVIAYTAAMFFLYTGTPILFRLSSAAFFNLSILTSDFYSLAFAINLFGEKMHRLYPLAYVGTMLGLIIYNIYPATRPKIEEHNKGDIELNNEVNDNYGAE